MDGSSELLLKRIQEAIDIIGSQKKLCELSGVSTVTLSRLKGYHRGTTNLPQKRESLSVKSLKKLADAIGEDISFFTSENYESKRSIENFKLNYYTNKEDINKNSIFSEDMELMDILRKIHDAWNKGSTMDKGFISLKIEQFFYEYEDLIKKREVGDRKTA